MKSLISRMQAVQSPIIPVSQAIARAITPKTRAVVTIYPNNPTGVVYSEETLYQVNQMCRARAIRLEKIIGT